MRTLNPRGAVTSLASWLALAAFTSPVQAEWTSFRNGGESHADTSLPTEWSADSGIAWEQELQGYGQSSPVIHDGAIYTTSVIGAMCETCLIECHDLKSGEVRWTYRHESTHGHPSNYMNARAAPTPTVDDQGVYAFFETGDLVAVDRVGQLLWSRDETETTGKFDNSHGVGASLAQNDSHVFLNLEHGGPSFLVAIEKQTGNATWTVDRKSSKSWSSPIIATIDGREQVILSSGGSVASYDATTGQTEWSIGGIEGNSVPSPTLSGHHLIIGARLPEFASDGDVRSNCCLDLSNVQNGKPHVVWRADKAICEYASPVVVDDHAYFLNKANVLHCLDIATGDVRYRKRIQGTCWATPIVSDGNVYFFSKNGECKVVAAGPEFESLATNRLWNPDSAPTPETYTESSGQSGSHGHGGAHGHGGSAHSGSKSSGAGGGMAARLMAGDQNGDGILQQDEVPTMFRGMMSRIDTSGDGELDAKEIDAMVKSFAERRKDAAATSRDPIVYGVAASDGHIVVRTGTRLFAIGNRGR